MAHNCFKLLGSRIVARFAFKIPGMRLAAISSSLECQHEEQREG